MKNIILLVILFFSIYSYGQKTIQTDTKEKTTVEKQKASDKVFKKILIIPFDEKLFLSDVNMMLAKESNKDGHAIMSFFRTNIVHYIYSGVSRDYIPKTMSNNETTDEYVDIDLQTVYSTLGYKYDVPMNSKEDKDDAKTVAQKAQAKDKTSKEAPKSGIVNGEIVIPPQENLDNKYLNVILNDKSVVPYLANFKSVDYILFINQFEIRYDISDSKSLALGNKILRVHYSLFDSNSKQLLGNSISYKIDGKMNNVTEIVKEYFPKIVDIIKNQMYPYSK